MLSIRFRGAMLSLSVLVVVVIGAGAVLGQQGNAPAATGSSTGTPPIDLKDPAAIEAGKTIFRHSCTTYCHGREGQGGGLRGPTLRNGNFENPYLFQVISSGRASMPAFSGTYTPEQIWQVIAYIQSLRD
jgi:mono/diheme cytochrome c family protein